MTDKAISPLRQRMIEDMTARHFAEKVQTDYIRHVKNFRPPNPRSIRTHVLGSGTALAVNCRPAPPFQSALTSVTRHPSENSVGRRRNPA
jgi:hypothetical protein